MHLPCTEKKGSFPKLSKGPSEPRLKSHWATVAKPNAILGTGRPGLTLPYCLLCLYHLSSVQSPRLFPSWASTQAWTLLWQLTPASCKS